ncbi:MAG: hypothetical protein P9M13_08320 [Candidatus Ancaeobacter aquaticus]|nr:hypothetical protein [Candidatus Ancaeobacter aquaticus]
MTKKTDSTLKKSIYRILDANINRLREALRVVEEVARFIVGDKKCTQDIKRCRHTVQKILSQLSIEEHQIELCRDSQNDVGKNIKSESEANRNGVEDILMANLHRAEESLRVLEEFFKIYEQDASLQCKKLRFEIYSIEKEMLKKII